MFKQANLEQNSYLILRMNNQLEIPIYCIKDHEGIKQITDDYKLIYDV